MMVGTYVPNIIVASGLIGLFTLTICAVFVGKWRMFEKAGRTGWAALVPFWSMYVEYDLIYGNGWRCLLLLVPVYGVVVFVRSCFHLAAVYGMDISFGFGLLFLRPLFVSIIGFNDWLFYDGTIPELMDLDDIPEEELEAIHKARVLGWPNDGL